MRAVLIASVLLVALAAAHTIKHVVVLMEENRSFDHLLGRRKGVNGLTGKEFNYRSNRHHDEGKVFVNANASDVAQCDPDHDFGPTSEKIFGYEAVRHHNFTTPLMDGFVSFEAYRGETKTDYCEVMNGFPVEKLPVLNALADNYVLMDNFFASLPGPTWPNRIFFLAGTSGGLTETDNPWFLRDTGKLFNQTTIYDQITAVNRTWKNYVNDTPWELMMETVAHNPENVVLLDEFFDDAKKGTLPDFAFINPRAGVNVTTGLGSSDMHPDHDVAVAERYYKDIYEALRASPAWNDTLFILTFDEHGGFYDHVPTPLNIPPPGDGIKSYPDKFNFDRSGIRIPTILISPWVNKGEVLSKPPAAQKPFKNSEYELTSIMATVRKIFNMNVSALTKRDAWAATFEQTLSQPTPRTDCPMHLPNALPPKLHWKKEAATPINSLQKHFATVHAHLAGVPYPHHITTQAHISQWLQDAFASHKGRTMHWKRQKANATYVARCEPLIGMAPPYAMKFISANWTIATGTPYPIKTVSINVAPKYQTPQWYCLDSGAWTEGTVVATTPCYPSPDPKKNRDKSQHWVLTQDATLRPFYNQHLCLQNACIGSSNLKTQVTLEKCNGKLNQRWGYQGAAAGNKGWSDEGLLSEGDAIYTLVVDTA